MAGKGKKNNKQLKNTEGNAPAEQNRAAQWLFAIFALLIIVSMVLSAAVTY